jgi:O-antigen/teichoic acid export membrane protein
MVFVYILFKHKEVWGIKTEIKELFPILKFCWPLALGAALGYFSNGYDKNILEGLGNNIEFGYYCVGTSIAAYLSVFTSSISSTFQPDTYEAIINDNRPKLLKVVAVRWFLTLGVVIAFILFCPLVIKILTAGKYMAATPYARIFACVSLTSSLYYIINDYSIARGKPHLYLITTIIGSVAIVALMPVAIEHYSFAGGAIMNVLSFVVLFVINLLLLLFCKTNKQ